MWLRDPRCAEVVHEAWSKGLYKIVDVPITNCLDNCKARLAHWNDTKFGHVGRQITRLEKELQVLEHNSQSNFEQIQSVCKSLNSWLDVENTMWHQRAKHMWIIDGDRNTSFFHQKASNHKQRNTIHGLTDDIGVWQEEDQIVENIILDYFSNYSKQTGPLTHL